MVKKKVKFRKWLLGQLKLKWNVNLKDKIEKKKIKKEKSFLW